MGFILQKKKTEGGAIWVSETQTADVTTPVTHRTVTKELIFNWASNMGDHNPLYRDDNYARNTRWGSIIAPPLFPLFAICGYSGQATLDVPPSIGEYDECTAWYRLIFNKPIRPGDSFRVREAVGNTIEDMTRLDGKGQRAFLIKRGRKYINQNDEVAVFAYNKRSVQINPPGQKILQKPILPLLHMHEYKYTREELDYIEHVWEESEIRGANPSYWEDVNVGDELKPVAFGPITIVEAMGSVSYNSIVRDLAKIVPPSVFVDPDTGITHHRVELHLLDSAVRFMGGTIAVTTTISINNALCRLVTNWMGDDGFMRMYDSHHFTIVPLGDSFICKGKVANKRVENGEHLVDLVLWVENLRGFVPQWAKATVSLYSRNEV